MKRIVSIIGDVVKVSIVVAIVGVTVFAASSANAQDLYQIEQSFSHEFRVSQLDINRGWDARLIQTPKGTPTRLVVTTPCANFFEEGAEPSMMDVQKYKSAKYGWYELKANQWMPRTTVVEIYTSQPIDHIELHKGAHLTIQYFDFDSLSFDIIADTGAVLIVDTMLSRGSIDIDLYNATLDLHHFTGNKLTITANGESTVKEGNVKAKEQRLHRGEKAHTDITVTDSARHIYVDRRSRYDRERKLRMISLNLGLDLGMPMGIESNRYGSPYNTNFALTGHLAFISNNMEIKNNWHWTWNFGLDVMPGLMQLDNTVKVDGDRLVLDTTFGATPPRQNLCYWSIGLPVTLKYNFRRRGPFYGLYATLTPTFTFTPRIESMTLDEDSHRHFDYEKADILNHFNVRAAVGIDCSIGGLGRLEFFIDLLPTFKSSAEAPQTRMMGLSYVF